MILPILLLAGKLLSGAAAAAAVATIAMIAFADVIRKLGAHKVAPQDIGELIRERLANGQVKVVASVFSKKPLGVFPRKIRGQETFTGVLDPKLESLFAGKDRVEIKI